MSPSTTEHKTDITFYKEILDRERVRRKDLDSAVSQPITVCSILIALLYFLYNNSKTAELDLFKTILLGIICIAFTGFLLCLFFLARSYNNLIWGFEYEELPSTDVIREYQKGIATYSAAHGAEHAKAFDEYLIRNYVKCAANHIKLNDLRSLQLFHAKRALIAAIFLAIIGIILFIIKSLL